MTTSEAARTQVLEDATLAVMSDRNLDYGNPEDNFEDIASLWRAWEAMGGDLRSEELTATDVAVMMVLVKIARLKTSPLIADHWTDIAGYAACGYAAANADDVRFAEAAAEADSAQLEVEQRAAAKREHELLKDFGELTPEDFTAIRRDRTRRDNNDRYARAAKAVRTNTHTPRPGRGYRA